jgi:hypothetical protein
MTCYSHFIHQEVWEKKSCLFVDMLYESLLFNDESVQCSATLRGPFENFVDWRQCAAVMQREAVTYAKL